MKSIFIINSALILSVLFSSNLNFLYISYIFLCILVSFTIPTIIFGYIHIWLCLLYLLLNFLLNISISILFLPVIHFWYLIDEVCSYLFFRFFSYVSRCFLCRLIFISIFAMYWLFLISIFRDTFTFFTFPKFGFLSKYSVLLTFLIFDFLKYLCDSLS